MTITEKMEPELLASIKTLSDELLELRTYSLDAFFTRNFNAGNHIIEQGLIFNEKIQNLKETLVRKDIGPRLQLNRIVDSLERINFYTVNIGEATVDSAYSMVNKN